jgi:hypothetical protein
MTDAEIEELAQERRPMSESAIVDLCKEVQRRVAREAAEMCEEWERASNAQRAICKRFGIPRPGYEGET